VHESRLLAGEPSDEVLAQRVQLGDRDALEQLVGRFLRPIHAVTASFLPERADVDDAVQETFLRALDRMASYSADRPFAPWLYEIARNVARNHLAASVRRRTEPLPVGGLEEPAPGPDIVLERAEIRRRVDAAIAELPEQRRTAFRLHDVDGYTTNETARLMGLSVGTIRSHVHHARRALRTALANSFERTGEKQEIDT
jgi:RNA polymerase sigma-70 factor (ECF subfamily)